MEYTVRAKFEIGDILKVKGSSTVRISVGGITFEVCPGGIQVIYRGIQIIQRELYINRDGAEEKGWTAVLDKEICLNEVLLEKLNLV